MDLAKILVERSLDHIQKPLPGLHLPNLNQSPYIRSVQKKMLIDGIWNSLQLGRCK